MHFGQPGATFAFPACIFHYALAQVRLMWESRSSNTNPIIELNDTWANLLLFFCFRVCFSLCQDSNAVNAAGCQWLNCQHAWPSYVGLLLVYCCLSKDGLVQAKCCRLLVDNITVIYNVSLARLQSFSRPGPWWLSALSIAYILVLQMRIT